MASKVKEVCAYCGREEPETRDHIPPVAFFPHPRAADLITVPCCQQCWAGWSDDDEYFRYVVLTAFGVDNHPEVQQPMQAVFRSLFKPRKRGFSRMVQQSLTTAEIKTARGLYVGSAPAIKVQWSRLERVAERIVRGLFFRERGYPLPRGYQALGALRQFITPQMHDWLKRTRLAGWRRIQNGAFSYTFAATTEDPDSTFWVALFYDTVLLFGFTVPAAV